MAQPAQPGRARGVTRWPLLLLLAAASLPLPGVLPPFWVTLANYAGIATIVATGLVVLTGYGGMTSFAQATFMGLGAYTTAILTTRYGVDPWLALPAALGVSLVGALAIGAVTLRLSGHYLALGTIAWAVSAYYLFGNLDVLGRNDGISAIPPISVFGRALIDSRSMYGLIATAVALSLVLTHNLLDSRPGRAIRALRGGAVAAASFGVDLPRTRLLAFAYAAVLAGLAGWLYAHLQRSVNPTPFGLNASIQYLLMAVVGGVGSIWGGLIGAVLVTVVNDQLQNILPRLLGATGNYEVVVFGLLLVVLLQTAPAGLWPLLRRRNLPRPRPIVPAPPLPGRAMPAPGTPLLAASGLRKQFGGLVAVNNLDIDVTVGEIVGLIGPNGAGKSTTFNLLTGVAQPSAGTLSFQGTATRLDPQRAARLGIGRTFQHVKLVPDMTVLENVALGAHLLCNQGPVRAALRLNRGEEARLFAHAARQLDRVGLSATAAAPVQSLALGQQRIVEIARALCLDPLLLLLDEPAAGLRHAEKQELAALLRRLRDGGMTIVLVEHDMAFVTTLAGRLVVMEFGAKLAEGPPAAIRANPAVIEAYLGAPA